MKKLFTPIANAFIDITTSFSALAYPTYVLSTTKKSWHLLRYRSADITLNSSHT